LLLRAAGGEALDYVFASGTWTDAGESALPQLILLDLKLPDIHLLPVLNGPDAAIEISALRTDVPLIFATGYATESDLQEVRSFERAVILPKPYNVGQLSQKIREALGRREKPSPVNR
jgi:CheY-like chemotaxis protein